MEVEQAQTETDIKQQLLEELEQNNQQELQEIKEKLPQQDNEDDLDEIDEETQKQIMKSNTNILLYKLLQNNHDKQRQYHQYKSQYISNQNMFLNCFDNLKFESKQDDKEEEENQQEQQQFNKLQQLLKLSNQTIRQQNNYVPYKPVEQKENE